MAATVTGSRLRGLDHPGSDVDVLAVLLAHPAYAPVLTALRPNRTALAAHAQRFAHHAAGAAGHAHAAFALAHGLPALLDREQAAPGSPTSLLVADWLLDYAAHRREAEQARGVDRPQDLPRATACPAAKERLCAAHATTPATGAREADHELQRLPRSKSKERCATNSYRP